MVATLGLQNFQGTYDASTSSPMITVDATNGPVVIQDNATPIGSVFEVRDQNGFAYIEALPADLRLGRHDAIVSTAADHVLEIQDANNSIRWWPGDRTFTSAQGSLMALQDTYTLNYANVSFGGLNLQATIIHQQAGFPFNHGLLFNHGNTYYNSLNVAANFGPLQGFIDQPSVFVNRTTAGTITQGLFRSFLSQPKFGRESTNGTISVTSAANFQAFGDVRTGATIATFTHYVCGPFTAPMNGTVTQAYGIDVADEPGPTNVTALRIQQNTGSGTRRAIDVTGTAPSSFNGDVTITNTADLLIGSTSPITIDRSAASTLRLNSTLATPLTLNMATANVYTWSASGFPGNGEVRWGAQRFAFGQTGAVGNQVGVFVANTRSTSVAGEWSDFLLTQSGNITLNAAMSLVAGWTVNAPSITLGTGSVTTAGVLNVGGNVNQGTTNRFGLRILSNPTGASTINAALWVTAGNTQLDGNLTHTGANVGFFGATPVAQSAAYTRNAVVVEDRTLLASASATVTNNNNVLAALIADLQAIGILG